MFQLLPPIARTINFKRPANLRHSLNRGCLVWWMNLPTLRRSFTAYDLCGNLDANLLNFTLGRDRVGAEGRMGGYGSFSFQTASSRVSAALAGPTPSGSFGCWAKQTNDSSQNIIMQGGTSATAGDQYLRIEVSDSNNVVCHVGTGSAWGNVLDGSTWPSNQWNHVFLTHDGPNDTTRLYLNGIQAAEDTGDTVVMASVPHLIVGGYTTSNNFDWRNSEVDDIRVYDRAISASEVGALYREAIRGYPTTLNWISPLGSNIPAAAAGLSIPVAMHQYRQRHQSVA